MLFFPWQIPIQNARNEWWWDGRGKRGPRKVMEPLGHPNSQVLTPLPQVILLDETQDSLLTSHRSWCRSCSVVSLQVTMLFLSSASFVQALFKVIHFSVAFVLFIKCMCNFDPFSLPWAILLFPYMLQRCALCGEKKEAEVPNFFVFPLSSTRFMMWTPCFCLHTEIHLQGQFYTGWSPSNLKLWFPYY